MNKKVDEDKVLNRTKKIDIIKIFGYLFIILIVIGFIYYTFNYYGGKVYNKGFEDGKNAVLVKFVQNVKNNGQTEIKLKDNLSLSFVLKDHERKLTILEIINNIEENGYVSLYVNDGILYLKPFDPNDPNSGFEFVENTN